MGNGCVISQAAASMLCQQVDGMSLEKARLLTPKDMLDLLGCQISPLRQQCALLGLEALRALLPQESD
ncbi:iron-sulfur cluster assembly scaffold protein [Roseiconus nitratireducens]|uniref:Iron-sulfur cluster assembly scaffold protein n=1 Tax=Roseiconus nitratireducens TaxID=2605748 RepID=A0A5M6CC22_9BACT|nr:iron-sulfur cluster assembly scaffold protein [Roseiconus nitratireducens]